MPAPEEVDEIDTYLHLRKQRQERGEIPKVDYTPPFIKKFGQAILGKKTLPKPMLKSMQPTYASVDAQAAMRRQIEEVMNERAKKNAAPAPLPALDPRSTAPVSKSAPFVPPWSRESTPPRPSESPSPVSTPNAALGNTLSPSAQRAFVLGADLPQAGAPSSSMWTRFQTWMNTKPANRISGVAIPSSSSNAPHSKPSLQAVVPLVSVARQPGYVPIDAVEKPSLDYPEREPRSRPFQGEIPPVKINLQTEMDSPSPRDAPVRAALPTPEAPASSANAPPWVRRAAPMNSIPGSIADVAKNGTLENLPWISAKESARQQSYQHYLESKKNSGISPTGAIASSMKSAGVKPPLSSFSLPSQQPADDSPLPASPVSASSEQRPPLPARLKPWVSGEVNLDAETKKSERKKKEEDIPLLLAIPSIPSEAPTPVPTASPESAREEEISEEEALEQLPFEEVEGLTDSDLDYLERKEREHRAQDAKKDPDYVVPGELNNRLQQQSARMAAVLPGTDARSGPPSFFTPAASSPAAPVSPTNPAVPPVALSPAEEKEAILRRLKKMMEESGVESPDLLPKQ